MAAKSKSQSPPKWLIDLHGIKDALTTRSNARARIIDAIESGEMHVCRCVQLELKNVYPDLWDDFVDIKPKTYIDTPVTVMATAAQLQEMHGTSLLGGIPDFLHFENIALAHSLGAQLVSAAKGLNDCRSIAKKCKLPSTIVQDIASV